MYSHAAALGDARAGRCEFFYFHGYGTLWAAFLDALRDASRKALEELEGVLRSDVYDYFAELEIVDGIAEGIALAGATEACTKL